MKLQQFIGLLMLFAGLMVSAGMLFGKGNPIYWMITDIVVVIICSGSGIYLLLQKTQV